MIPALLSALALVFAYLALTSKPVFWLMVIVFGLAALTDEDVCVPRDRRPRSRPRSSTPSSGSQP